MTTMNNTMLNLEKKGAQGVCAPEGEQRKGFGGKLTFLTLSLLLLTAWLPSGLSAQSAAPNPDLLADCPLKVALVLDESQSIADAGSTDKVRNSAQAFVDALAALAIPNNESELAVVEFSTAATLVNIGGNGAGFQKVTTAYAADFGAYINTDYNPNGNTNWEDAFLKVLSLPAAPDLVVFMTDGNPTAYVNSSGNTVSGSTFTSLLEAIPVANNVKNNGSHIYVVGLGNVDEINIRQISGPQKDLAPGDQPGPDPGIAQADFTLISFDELLTTLAAVPKEACGTVMVVEKTISATVCEGGQETFTITVSNAADGVAARSVTVTDEIMTGYDFVSSNPAPASQTDATYTWDLGDIPDGGNKVIYLTVEVNSEDADHSNKAVVVSTTALDASGSVEDDEVTVNSLPTITACPGDLDLNCGEDYAAVISGWMSTFAASDGATSASPDDLDAIVDQVNALSLGVGGGAITVTFIATNDCGSEECTADIVVPFCNVAPQGVNDTDNTPEDTQVTTDVAANDTDANGNLDPGSVSIETDPANGAAVSNGDGTVTYTPNADYCGADSYTYRICDVLGLCATATVTINVGCVNDAPVAADDTDTTDEDTAVTTDVAANDTDVDGNLALSSVAIVNPPSEGAAEVNGDGTITYTPKDDYCGDDAYTYRICDGVGICDEATVTLTVNCVNDDPVAANDNDDTEEDTAVTTDVAANDTDVDGNLDIASVVVLTNPANGQAQANGDGTITYEPATNFCGDDSYTYRICDTDGACDEATVAVFVSCGNDKPEATADADVTNEDNPVTTDVASNDTDIDGNLDPSSVSIVNNPANGTAAATGDGAVTYAPAADFCGSDSYTYRICDSEGLCDEATVSVEVICVNDPPSAVNDSASTPEETPVVADLAANDSDIDGNLDPNTVSVVSQPTFGTATANGDGTVTYMPVQDYCGPDAFTYRICDTDGLCAEATATVDVTCVNDDPVANNDTDAVVEGSSVATYVALNDTDIDGNLDPTTVTVLTAPAHGTATSNNDGTVTYQSFDGFCGGADSYTYRICDTEGACAEATVTIDVACSNLPPVANNDLTTCEPGTPTQMDVFSNDQDPDGQVVASTITIVDMPDHGILQVDQPTGMITYTAPADACGEVHFTYTVSDDDGATSNLAMVTIQILDNQPPAFNCPPAIDVNCDDVRECITFETFATGEIVSSITTQVGEVTVSGFNPNLPAGTNAAMIFDSSNPTGDDDDLGSPNEDFGGPGIGVAGQAGAKFQNDRALGKVLIVSMDLDSSNPDDEASPQQTLTFNFPQPVTLEHINLMDVESATGAHFLLYGPGDALLADIPSSSIGDNGLQLVNLGPTASVVKMLVQLNSSGAIDNLCYTTAAPTGFPVATDNCDSDPLGFSFVDTELPGACPQAKTIERTWTARDNGGNPTTCVQLINVVDQEGPVVTTDAADLTMQCDGAGNTSEIDAWLADNGGAAAEDNCGDVSWTNDYTGLTDITCGGSGSALVTFTAADGCGNSTTTTGTIIILDTIAPVMVLPATDLLVEADGAGNVAGLNAWLANNGGAQADDQCSGITWSNDYQQLDASCGQTGSTTVTFTATDACGNSATTSATFTIEDNTSPTILVEASNIDVACGAAAGNAALNAWLADNGGAEVSDLGGSVTWTNDFSGLGSGCGATGVVTVTFTATDECGNTAVTSATFSSSDDEAPQGSCPQGLVGLETMADVPDPDPAAVAANYTDACGGPVFAELVNQYTGGTDCGTFNVHYVYEVSDECGNTTQCEVVHQGNNPNPLVGLCPEGFLKLVCMADVPAPDEDWVAAHYTGNGPVTATFIGADVVGDECSGFTVHHTYQVTDGCDVEICKVKWEGIDDRRPDGVCPQGMTGLQCVADIPEPDPDAVAAAYFDDCGAVTVSLVETIDDTDNCYDFSRTYVYAVVDGCGNTAYCTMIHSGQGDACPDCDHGGDFPTGRPGSNTDDGDEETDDDDDDDNPGGRPGRFNIDNPDDPMADLIDVSPNPSRGGELRVHIASELEVKDGLTLSVFDINGRLIYTIDLKPDEITGVILLNVDRIGLADGTYLLNVKTNESTISKKLIVSRF